MAASTEFAERVSNASTCERLVHTVKVHIIARAMHTQSIDEDEGSSQTSDLWVPAWVFGTYILTRSETFL